MRAGCEDCGPASEAKRRHGARSRERWRGEEIGGYCDCENECTQLEPTCNLIICYCMLDLLELYTLLLDVLTLPCTAQAKFGMAL
jgi:hypothetical protein